MGINSRAKSPVLRSAPSCPATAALILCAGNPEPEGKNKFKNGLHKKRVHPPAPQCVERSLRASPSSRTGRSVLEGKELAGAGLLPLSEMVSQPRARDRGRAGARQASASRLRQTPQFIGETSSFPARQLPPTGHVRGSENGSFSVIKYKRGVNRGGGGSL